HAPAPASRQPPGDAGGEVERGPPPRRAARRGDGTRPPRPPPPPPTDDSTRQRLTAPATREAARDPRETPPTRAWTACRGGARCRSCGRGTAGGGWRGGGGRGRRP